VVINELPGKKRVSERFPWSENWAGSIWGTEGREFKSSQPDQ